MPLQDAVPVIDDRKFLDISEEMRTRIARYAPEWKPEAVWSDFNYSDPGIILAHTFAWLGEMLLYRMSKVPDLNYVKFLEMVGIELREAQPARVDITFPVADDFVKPFVDVPPRTQVSAAIDGEAPVVFETERSLLALSAQMKSVQVIDAGGALDRTPLNVSADATFLAFGELAAPDTALVIGFGYAPGYPTPDEFPQITLDLSVYCSSRATGRPVVSCSLPTSTSYAPARLEWEYWDGADWQSMRVLRDETLAISRTGRVLIRTPPVGAMKRDIMGAYTDSANPLFWMRARVKESQYERPPELIALRTNTVAALQAETVVNEILGGSNGRPNQRWLLGHRPILPGSLRITIDDGPGPAPWAIVGDLLGAGPTDQQLALNASSGEVVCGDGITGDIPVANVNNPDANVVAAEYRFGGGVRGNVAARTVTSLLSNVDGVNAGAIQNLFAAAGGSDEESLAEAKKRARLSLRARCRAVTAEDFELFAMEAGNVRRAKALPLRTPSFPAVAVPGAVTVIVVPDAPASVPDPSPSEAMLRTVCAYLDARRLITTEVYVVAPAYQEVSVSVELVAKNDADISITRDAVENTLTCYFHPLFGGDDGQGWPFGGTIRYSKVYQRVFEVEGVDSIEHLVITIDGEAQPECRDVALKENALLYSVHHEIALDHAADMEATP